MRHPLYHLSLAIIFGLSATITSTARDNAISDSDLRPFFTGFDEWALRVDCPEKTYEVGQTSAEGIRLCLPFSNAKQARCEIYAINGTDIRDKNYKISYEIALDKDWKFVDDWIIISQIHSRPDPGEAWRCPLFSLEVHNNSLRLVSRHDLSRITDPGHICASGSSTMRARMVFQNVPLKRNQWHSLEFAVNLSLSPRGSIVARLNARQVGAAAGSNTFNDRSAPFIKFGVYKAHPRPAHGLYCARFRSFELKEVK